MIPRTSRETYGSLDSINASFALRTVGLFRAMTTRPIRLSAAADVLRLEYANSLCGIFNGPNQAAHHLLARYQCETNRAISCRGNHACQCIKGSQRQRPATSRTQHVPRAAEACIQPRL